MSRATAHLFDFTDPTPLVPGAWPEYLSHPLTVVQEEEEEEVRVLPPIPNLIHHSLLASIDA